MFMKKLFLIRHAKSSWDNHNLSDFERPLNKRGLRDAPFMAKLINKEKIKPDIIYSSPALRAASTAEFFAEELNYKKKKIILDENIYEAGIRELEHIVQNIANDKNTAFLFGHNPTITYYANHLGNKLIDNMPTCSIVGIEFNEDTWNKVEHGKGNTFFFEYPKKYFNVD